MGVVLAVSRLILGGVQESLFVITLAKKLLFCQENSEEGEENELNKLSYT